MSTRDPTRSVDQVASIAFRGRPRAIALLVAGAFFMEILDGTVIATALPAIAADLGVAAVDLNIGMSAYLLTIAVFIPLSGWTAERFGARTVFAASIVVFTAASVLCALTETLPLFVAARVLQGIGGAMMVPVGRLVVLQMTPKHQLVAAIAVITWPGLIAPVIAPALGGWITTTAGWEWIFYLNLPLGVVALAFSGILPQTRRPDPPPLDWTGFVLTAGAAVGILVAAEFLGAAEIDAFAAAGFAAAGIALAVLAVRHFRRAEHPLIDLAAMRVKSFRVTIWGASLFRMSIGAVPFLVPLMLQVGYGLDPFQAGLYVLAVFAGNLAMKLFTTRMLRRFGFRRILVVNGLLNAVAILAMAAITPAMPYALAFAILFASGVVRSMQFTSLNTLAFADIPAPDMTAANTLQSMVFQMSMGLGVTLGAVALRAGEAVAPAMGLAPVDAFKLAFVVIAAVAAVAVIDVLGLSADTGRHVSGHRPKL